MNIKKVFLSKSRIEISNFLVEMKSVIYEVPSKQRKEIFSSNEIIQLNSMKDAFIGGNRILYKQIMNLLEE